jgi:hypothetical protein
MRTHFTLIAPLTIALVCLPVERAAAQATEAPANAPQVARQEYSVGPLTPLKVQVTISQYQGDKKISSVPYVLSVNSNDRAMSSLRMGARLPVPTISVPTTPDGARPAVPFSYESIGTKIDCSARTLEDGRFRLTISIEDSAIYPATGARPASGPDLPQGFRTFTLSNTAVLKDGQTTQFTTVTDKISGDLVKVDVTLNVAN